MVRFQYQVAAGVLGTLLVAMAIVFYVNNRNTGGAKAVATDEEIVALRAQVAAATKAAEDAKKAQEQATAKAIADKAELERKLEEAKKTPAPTASGSAFAAIDAARGVSSHTFVVSESYTEGSTGVPAVVRAWNASRTTGRNGPPAQQEVTLRVTGGAGLTVGGNATQTVTGNATQTVQGDATQTLKGGATVVAQSQGRFYGYDCQGRPLYTKD